MEYGVPRDWKRMSDEELLKFFIAGEKPTEDNDVECQNSFSLGAKPASSSGTTLKKEKEDVTAPRRTKTEVFLADPTETLKRVSDYMIELKQLNAMTQEHKFCEALGADCVKLVTKLQKIKTSIEKITIGEKPDAKVGERISQQIARTSRISYYMSFFGVFRSCININSCRLVLVGKTAKVNTSIH